MNDLASQKDNFLHEVYRDVCAYQYLVESGLSNKILARFSTMMSDDAWDVGDEIPDIRSVNVMLRLLCAVKAKIVPSIGVAGTDEIFCVFRKGQNRLTLVMPPKGKVGWALLCGNADNRQHVGGDSYIHNLTKDLETVTDIKWFD